MKLLESRHRSPENWGKFMSFGGGEPHSGLCRHQMGTNSTVDKIGGGEGIHNWGTGENTRQIILKPALTGNITQYL